MNDSTQPDLVERAVAGEPLALDRLLLDAYPRLTARVDQKLPLEVRSVVSPEDIIQDTFADAFRRIASFRPEGKDAFYRWLTAIADNRMTDSLRAHRAARCNHHAAGLMAADDRVWVDRQPPDGFSP